MTPTAPPPFNLTHQDRSPATSTVNKLQSRLAYLESETQAAFERNHKWIQDIQAGVDHNRATAQQHWQRLDHGATQQIDAATKRQAEMTEIGTAFQQASAKVTEQGTQIASLAESIDRNHNAVEGRHQQLGEMVTHLREQQEKLHATHLEAQTAADTRHTDLLQRLTAYAEETAGTIKQVSTQVQALQEVQARDDVVGVADLDEQKAALKGLFDSERANTRHILETTHQQNIIKLATETATLVGELNKYTDKSNNEVQRLTSILEDLQTHSRSDIRELGQRIKDNENAISHWDHQPAVEPKRQRNSSGSRHTDDDEDDVRGHSLGGGRLGWKAEN